LQRVSFSAGFSIFRANDAGGFPNDTLFLKQGEHLMKKGVYPAAQLYLQQSLKINPESKVTAKFVVFSKTILVIIFCLKTVVPRSKSVIFLLLVSAKKIN
jgi:hypothetical protein